jgi:eukaryotic-like serine/threonine-protein kinase
VAEPNLGRMLQNRYRLLQTVGQGAMGHVYGAEDVSLGGIPVAVKFLSQTLLNQKMRQRFEREAKTCAQLGQRSIHIVRVTDYGVDEDGIPFYVMEYLKGDSLSEVINHRPLSLPRFLNLTRQICLGLQCAHQGILIDGRNCPIVHRDIKPSNILVSKDDSLGELIKILDFGIAKVLEAGSSQTQCFMGTLAYSSPEQMEGRELDARADIYSLGVMMFQMLTGKMPIHADTHSFGGWYKAHHFQAPRSIAAVNPAVQVPKNLEALVMSCLAKSPADRPQSVNEVMVALEALESDTRDTGRHSRPATSQSKSQSKSQANTAQFKVKALEPVRQANSYPGQQSHPDSELSRTATWPSNMPLAEIVFPRALPTQNGPVPTLWVMMPQQEIQRRVVCTRYNQFLFMEAPHPMALWLTVLYNRGQDPRWLPCYLDLRAPQGRQMANLLAKAGQYSILFFSQDDPKRCAYTQKASVATAQCNLLRQWTLVGQQAKGIANPTISKDHLRSALETIKPQVLTKLDSIYGSEEVVSGALPEMAN